MTKRYFLHVLFLLIGLPALAQRPKPAAVSLPPADTVYFDRDWERTEILEEVSYARVARHDGSGKTVGTVRDYFYPSWKKQWEGKMASEMPDKPTGLCCGWHENGQVSFRGSYVNGVQQTDFRSWQPNGREIKCTYSTVDALPLSNATIHCSTCVHLSRKVFEVEVPEGTAGIVYKLDIRDGETPPSWSTVMGLASAFTNPATGSVALLSMVASILSTQNTGPTPTVSTKCRWYITLDPAAVEQFMATQGSITIPNSCLRAASNTPQETRPITVPPGTRRLFVCVNNDNYRADATATLSVTALVKSCK